MGWEWTRNKRVILGGGMVIFRFLFEFVKKQHPYKPKQAFFKHVARAVLRSQCSDPINLMDAQLFVQHRCHIYIYTRIVYIFAYAVYMLYIVSFTCILYMSCHLYGYFQIPTLICPFPSDKKRKKTCTNCQADLTSIAKAARKEWQDGEVITWEVEKDGS